MYVHDKVNIFPANRLTFFRKVPFGKDYLRCRLYGLL